MRSRLGAGAWLLCAALLGALTTGVLAEEAPEQLESLMEEARSLVRQNQPAMALSALKKAERLDKSCHECLVLRSRAYLGLRRRKDAIKTAMRVIEGDAPTPMKVQAHNLVALSLQRDGRCEPKDCARVERELLAAVRLSEGEDPAVRFNLGIFLVRNGRQEEGLATLREVMEDGIDLRTSRWIQLILAEPECVDGTCAPDYALTTLDGRFFNRNDLKGKATLLYFLTPDAGSQYSVPTLNSLSKRVEQDPFALFAISFVDERTLGDFGQTHDVKFPLCHDRAGDVAGAFGVQLYPAAVVIDHRGHVAWHAAVRSREAHAHLDAAVGDAIKKAREAATEEPRGAR